MRLSCTQAMLQCLEPHERMAFVLGEIFELGSADAAWILDTTPTAYRKRLERARTRIRGFMQSTCGLVNPNAFCRCARRIPRAIELGRIDPERLTFVTHPIGTPGRNVAHAAAQLATLHDAAAVLRAHPDYAAPQARIDAIVTLLHSGRFPMLDRSTPRPS